MRKLSSWGFQTCGSFWDLKVLSHSYWLSKSRQIQRKILLGKRRYEKKTRPQFRFFGPTSFWTGVIAAQSWQTAEILDLLPKIRGVTKKRHGHNNEFWGLKRIAGPPNHVRRPCYSFQDPKLNIVAVSFFGNARFYWNFFSKFDPTLSAYNYASKTPNLKNYHIFGILRTSAFTWYPPI